MYRPLPAKVVVEEVDVYDFFVLFKKDQAVVNFAQGYWTKNRDKEWSLNTKAENPLRGSGRSQF